MSKQAWITLLVYLLAACSSGPVRQFVKGDEVYFNSFSEPDTFETGNYAGARLQIIDGVYRITVTQGDGTLWWGQWGDIYDNITVDVDVNQLSERNENMYGVMCRVRGAVGLPVAPDATLNAIMSLGTAAAPLITEGTEMPAEEATSEATAEAESTTEATTEATGEATSEATQVVSEEATEEATQPATEEPTSEATSEATTEATVETGTSAPEEALTTNNGDGYLFLIRGDGGYAIMRSRGRDITPLVNWGISDAITRGPGHNHIRAACVGDYLALYVNDKFVADAVDDAYNRGQVALVAAAVDRLGVEVEFDNLSISQATPGQ